MLLAEASTLRDLASTTSTTPVDLFEATASISPDGVSLSLNALNPYAGRTSSRIPFFECVSSFRLYFSG